MTLFWKFIDLFTSEHEKRILDLLDKHGKPSMKVVGRGTLTMSVKDGQDSEHYRRAIAHPEKILSKT